MTALFTLPIKELLTIYCILLLLTAIAGFYYVIIQPKQHEKIIRRKQASKQEIDAILDKYDPFSETELQGLRNN